MLFDTEWRRSFTLPLWASKSILGKMEFRPEDLQKIANWKMPFGRYKDLFLIDLPEPYVVWFHGQGFPEGELGRLLAQLYEIKVNGLEGLLKPLRENQTLARRQK